MALLFVDGFDAGDMNVKWNVGSGGSSHTSTRFGAGRSLNINNSTASKTFTPSTQVFVGFAGYSPSSFGGYGTSFFRLYGDNGTTLHLYLQFPTTGSLALVRGGGTTLATASVLRPDDVWTYFEISATIADSGGTCVVKMNGTTVINFTGDTRNAGTSATIDTVTFSTGASSSVLVDDLYVCDATGSAPYNTFLGDIRINTLVPNGAGSDAGFTPSTGANYATVDELPYSATDYVSASTSGTRDLYTASDISGSYSVLAVQNNVIAKKTDAGGTAIKPAIKSGGTVYYGSNTTLIASDVTIRDLRTTNPATSTTWTLADVNNLEIGMEIV